MVLVLAVLLMLFVSQLSVILETSSPGFESLYSEVIWMGKIICIPLALVIAVIFKYGLAFVIDVYVAIGGYRLSELLPMAPGNRLVKALAIGSVFAFLMVCLAELLMDFIEVFFEKSINPEIFRKGFRK